MVVIDPDSLPQTSSNKFDTSGVVPALDNKATKPSNDMFLAQSTSSNMPINVRNSLQSLRYKQECRRRDPPLKKSAFFVHRVSDRNSDSRSLLLQY